MVEREGGAPLVEGSGRSWRPAVSRCRAREATARARASLAALGHAVHPDLPGAHPVAARAIAVRRAGGRVVAGDHHRPRRRRAARPRTGGFLFTHRGYSGPVGARRVARGGALQAGGRAAARLAVRWTALGEAEWAAALQPQGTRTVTGVLRKELPERLAEALAGLAKVTLTRPLAQLRREERRPPGGDAGAGRAALDRRRRVPQGGSDRRRRESGRGRPAHDGKPPAPGTLYSVARCWMRSARSEGTTSCGPGRPAARRERLPPGRNSPRPRRGLGRREDQLENPPLGAHQPSAPLIGEGHRPVVTDIGNEMPTSPFAADAVE